MRKYLFFLPLLFMSASCQSDDESLSPDCSSVLCEANFSKLYLEVLSRESADNVLANGEFDEEAILLAGSETIRFEIEDEFEKKLLVLSDSIWDTGSFEYTLKIGTENEFSLNLTLERTGGQGCCSNRLFLNSVAIDGDLHDTDVSPPVFSIIVDEI